jgi:hypothetical protein
LNYCPEVRRASRLPHPNEVLRIVASDHWIVLAVILSSTIAAWLHLTHSSIWYDEAITLLTTSGHAKLDWSLGLMQFKPCADLRRIALELYNQDVHPPLYFWALALWRVVFGPSLEVARSLSVLFGVATLALLYSTARDTGMRRPWVPVAVYAASSAGSWYAYDARPYAMTTCLILLTQVLARKKSKWTGVCAATSFATHYFAALCVVPVLLMGCSKRWKPERHWSLLTAVSFGIASAPLFLLLRIHLLARPNQFTDFGSFPAEVWALLKGAAQSVMPNMWFLPALIPAVLVGGFFAVAGIRWALREQKFTLPVLYGAFLCNFLLLALITNKSVAKMPRAYYLGIAAPWLAILIGFGVNALPRLSPLLAVAIIVGLIGARPALKMPNYREMLRSMTLECSHCPIVVGMGYVGAVPACVLYEARGTPVFLLRRDDSVNAVMEEAGGQGTVFFVPSNEPPTGDIEAEFVRSFSFARKNGYFEVIPSSSQSRVRAPRQPERARQASLAKR